VEPLEDRCCPSSYTVTDLGTLGGAESQAFGINKAGQVVGFSYNGSTSDAFLWTAGATDGVPSNRQMKDLGTLGGTSTSGLPSSEGTGINDVGQVVGEAYTASGAYHAFLWTKLGTSGPPSNPQMQDLGTLPGDVTSIAYGINPTSSHGVQVVGESDSASGQRHAFLWTQNGGMIPLGTLGGTFSIANAINDAGQVTGEASLNGDTVTHAFLWQNNVMTDLGPLSNGQAINGGGQVAGEWVPKSSTGLHGFRWTTGKIADLGTLNLGGTVNQSDARGINDAGSVVGWSGADLGVLAHAFYWPGKGAIQDLNSLILNNPGFAYLENATGINQGGQIVGEGPFPTLSTPHAFLLTPSTGQAPMAAAVPSLGNRGIRPADLGGRTLRLADETVHGANGQAAFNDVGEWSSILDATLLAAFLTKETP
jgi:probable HAF family extracellular repeat protein